jgi:hypothetical protein
MAVAPPLRSAVDIESFMSEYYAAWGGRDEDHIMSYYADNVTVQIPGSLMQGKSAREQFVRRRTRSCRLVSNNLAQFAGLHWRRPRMRANWRPTQGSWNNESPNG